MRSLLYQALFKTLRTGRLATADRVYRMAMKWLAPEALPAFMEELLQDALVTPYILQDAKRWVVARIAGNGD